jgi:hypothetical protein
VAAARNRIAREARTPWVLDLDDDAFVLSRAAVQQAIRVLETDPRVAAVAFPQCDEAGVPYAPSAQPAPVDYPCYVPTFIGYAHLLRREAFLAAGGFRERLGINGEEKDLCLRMLDEGWRVVYLPAAGMGHVAAAAGRDRRRYLHQTVRNSVVSAFCGEPMPLMPAGVAVRLWRYFPMRRGWGIDDPGGFGTIVRGLARELPSLVRERRPVRWETMRRWRAMTQSAPEPANEFAATTARSPPSRTAAAALARWSGSVATTPLHREWNSRATTARSPCGTAAAALARCPGSVATAAEECISGCRPRRCPVPPPGGFGGGTGAQRQGEGPAGPRLTARLEPDFVTADRNWR